MADDISPLHRVAAFLLSLDTQTASKVLAGMPDEVVEQVSVAMTELDDRAGSAESIDQTVSLIAQRLFGPVSVSAVPSKDLRSVIGASLGQDRADAIVDRIEEGRMAARPFADLETCSPDAIAAVLAKESMPIAALVLGNIDPTVAALILGEFEADVAAGVVHLMATSKLPAPAVVTTIGQDLYERASASSDGGGSSPAERLEGIAKVLNFSSAQTEANVIKSLAEHDEVMAAELREFMFTWEDIGAVDKRNMQKILGTVDTKTLSIALKASSPEVEDNVMNNLSERVRDMVREERDMAGPMALSEVKLAREEILKGVRALIEGGEFTPTRSGEELVE